MFGIPLYPLVVLILVMLKAIKDKTAVWVLLIGWIGLAFIIQQGIAAAANAQNETVPPPLGGLTPP
jgi:hypothetical protein